MSLFTLLICTVIATTSISGVEYLSRTSPDIVHALTRSAPLVVISQVCLYYIFSSGSSIMGAWITFTIAMSLSRIINSRFVLKEDLSIEWLLLGVTCMIISGLCIKQAHN
jgi:hypothetical protein